MCPLISSKSRSKSLQMAYLRGCVMCHSASQARPKRERTSIVLDIPRPPLSFHHVKCQSVCVCVSFVYVSVRENVCVTLLKERCAFMCKCVFCIHVFFACACFIWLVFPSQRRVIGKGRIRYQTACE